MTIAPGSIGNAVIDELSQSDSHDLFARRCREELGVEPEVFIEASKSGDYPEDWDIAAVSRVEFLLPFAR